MEDLTCTVAQTEIDQSDEPAIAHDVGRIALRTKGLSRVEQVLSQKKSEFQTGLQECRDNLAYARQP
jgi:hypothetical protein